MNDSDGHQHDADDGIKKGPSGRVIHSPRSEPFRRMEILTGERRRKTWPKEFKAAVIAETFAPGANVSAVARRHGVSIGLVHYWRKCARDGGFSEPSDDVPRFIPVVPEPPRFSGTITIEVCGALVRLEGAIDESNLGKVLSALRLGH